MSQIVGGRSTNSTTFDGPKIITLGGDHTTTLPALRALNKKLGKKLSVIHFDSHLGR